MTRSLRPWLRRAVPLALALALGAAWLPRRADAQIGNYPRDLPWQPRVGIGYAANIPNQFTGVAAHVLTDALGGMGVYVDAKFDLDTPESRDDYIDDFTAEHVDAELGDLRLNNEGVWRSVNVALMRSITSQLAVYAGAGYVNGTEYREYFDPERERGRAGAYWVRADEGSGSHVNFLGGAFFQVAESLAIQFGGESKPAGFTIGISYLVPLRR